MRRLPDERRESSRFSGGVLSTVDLCKGLLHNSKVGLREADVAWLCGTVHVGSAVLTPRSTRVSRGLLAWSPHTHGLEPGQGPFPTQSLQAGHGRRSADAPCVSPFPRGRCLVSRWPQQSGRPQSTETEGPAQHREAPGEAPGAGTISPRRALPAWQLGHASLRAGWSYAHRDLFKYSLKSILF